MLSVLFSLVFFSARAAPDSPNAELMEVADDGSVVFGGMDLRSPEDTTGVVFDTDDSFWSTSGTTAHRWSISTGKMLSSFDSPCALYGVNSLAVSPDGTQLAMACVYDTMKVVGSDGSVKTVFPEDVSMLQWSGNVIAGLVDEEVVFWSTKTGNEIHRLAVGYDASWSGRNGMWVVAGAVEKGSDRQFIVGLNAKGKQRWAVPVGSQSGFAWSSDGSEIAVVMDAHISVRETKKGEEKSFHETTYSIRQVLSVEGGWWLAGGSTVHLFDPDFKTTGEVKLVATDLISSPSGAWVIDPNGARPRVYSHEGVRHLGGQGLASGANTVAAAGDLIAAFSDHEVQVVVRSTGAHHALPLAAVAVAVAPRGDLAAFGGDGVVLVAPDGTSREVAGMEKYVGFDLLTFSEDGRWLWALSSIYETFLIQIDVEKGQVVNRRKIADQDAVGAVALPDGSGLIIPLDDGRLKTVPLVPLVPAE